MDPDSVVPAPELIPVPAAKILCNPLTARPYRAEPKSPAQSTAEWRKAAAYALSFEEKIDVFHGLHQLAMAGNVPAATLLLAYGMGKPGVGAAGKMMDDVVADKIQERLARLPLEKRRAALELLTLLEDTAQAEEFAGGVFDASPSPDGGEPRPG